MPLLILESLGSTELLFILVMALIFFGPRKLPQLSRKLGKSLAEFRRASEDFKSTWEREVALESSRVDHQNPNQESSSLLDSENNDQLTPTIRQVPADEQIPRDSKRASEPIETAIEYDNPTTPAPAQKRDWL